MIPPPATWSPPPVQSLLLALSPAPASALRHRRRQAEGLRKEGVPLWAFSGTVCLLSVGLQTRTSLHISCHRLKQSFSKSSVSFVHLKAEPAWFLFSYPRFYLSSHSPHQHSGDLINWVMKKKNDCLASPHLSTAPHTPFLSTAIGFPSPDFLPQGEWGRL